MTLATEPARCAWVPANDAPYAAYHDEEWGVPERDAKALFAKLCLDGMQAGLSWRTILYKRGAINAAFAGFNPHILADWGDAEVANALDHPGIIRSPLKARGMVKNARAYQALVAAHGDFSAWLWAYVDGAPLQNAWTRHDQVPAKTALSERLAKDLKRAGFSYCGPVIVYAFMQAVGMVNDHLVSCHRFEPCAALGQA